MILHRWLYLYVCISLCLYISMSVYLYVCISLCLYSRRMVQTLALALALTGCSVHNETYEACEGAQIGVAPSSISLPISGLYRDRPCSITHPPYSLLNLEQPL